MRSAWWVYVFLEGNQCQNDPWVSEKQPNQRQGSLSVITVFAEQCSRASAKRSQLVWRTLVGARAGSCCHSNHGGEIRAASDAVALPQWGGCSSCGRTDGTSRFTVTHHKATRKGKCRRLFGLDTGFRVAIKTWGWVSLAITADYIRLLLVI